MEEDTEVFESMLFPEGGRGDLRVVELDEKVLLFGFVTLPCWLSGTAGTAAALAAGVWHDETPAQCQEPAAGTWPASLPCLGSPFSWGALQQLRVLSCSSPVSDTLK